MRKLKLLLATMLVSFCCAQGVWADDVNYFDVIAKHALSDAEMTLSGNGWRVDNTKIYQSISVDNTISLSGETNLSTPSIICYHIWGGGSTTVSIDLIVDGNLVKQYSGNQVWKETSNDFYYFLNEGHHIVKWEFHTNSSTTISFEGIGLISAPEISVNLLEAGSLGTEVLYNVDNVKDVRNLKIKGKMNNDDYNTLKLMDNLCVLNLEEAEIDNIPFGVFAYKTGYYSTSYSNRFEYLSSIKLPSNLKSIDNYAFLNSIAEDIDIPSSVSDIGKGAFESSRIRSAALPNVVDLKEGTFDGCYLLEDISLSDNIESIGEFAFSGCMSIKSQTIHFPSTLTNVGKDAFSDCSNLNFRFPRRQIEFGREAFRGTAIDSLIVYDSWDSGNDESPFYDLSELVYVELPVNVSYLSFWTFLRDCDKLNTIKLSSPTVVGFSSNFKNISNITLKVPSYLVNSYKLADMWYNAKSIEGFSTSEVQNWTISRPLTLNARDRFEGNPDIYLKEAAALKINGDTPMSINDFHFCCAWYSSNFNDGWNTQVLSNSDNITINGELSMHHHCSPEKWMFICLPFDAKVSDAYNDGDAKYVIRYYDGEKRGTDGVGSNWKDYSENDIISAGTGFIVKVSAWSSVHFTAIDNEAKQYVVSNKEFVKSLQENPSSTAANRGWNLVGNPWHCYYNIHALNFTAPITVYNDGRYEAYSIIDDDYAIRPNQAFFVQCPDEVNSIGFPTNGRQLTDVIESQNGVKHRMPAVADRYLIDIELAGNTTSDKTRLVVNPTASLDYETNCDASKFFAMDNNMPQLYSIDAEGNEYAINERPLDNGIAMLGIMIPQDGTYTFKASRNELGTVMLIDHETGITTDLSQSSYVFEANAGTTTDRFSISFNNSIATGIEHIKDNSAVEAVYNLAGQRVTKPVQGIYIQNGKKVFVK